MLSLKAKRCGLLFGNYASTALCFSSAVWLHFSSAQSLECIRCQQFWYVVLFVLLVLIWFILWHSEEQKNSNSHFNWLTRWQREKWTKYWLNWEWNNTKTYAAIYNNNELIENSSSGAIFSALAEKFEVIYGVAMTEDCYGAVMIRVEGDISPLRG